MQNQFALQNLDPDYTLLLNKHYVDRLLKEVCFENPIEMWNIRIKIYYYDDPDVIWSGCTHETMRHPDRQW